LTCTYKVAVECCPGRRGSIVPVRRSAPLLLFAAAALLLFLDAVVAHRIYFQDDTVTYYLPLAQRIDEALGTGRLPLWTPYLFGGHPLFADSESAMLYPPNLIGWLLFDPVTALIAQRVLRFLLGGAFTYAFGRAIGMGRAAATLSGLSFALGSFLVGQIHHKNLADAAVWLPLVLCLVERGFQTAGPARLRWWLLGGGALGVQLLTIHVNPILMTGMMVAAYVAFRARGPREALMALALLGAVAGGLGAVQLVPMGELVAQTFRGRPVERGFALANALPPQNLLTLLFPYFFRDPGGVYWSPWFRWNTTIYGGVAPLLLALAAVALPGRRREVWFFLATFLVALCLALADRAPIPLYDLLRQLPVFASTRVPSRYLFLALFALAVLAGLGLDALRRALADGRTRPVGWLLHGLTAGATGVLLAFVVARHLALAEPVAARGWLEALYLGLPGRWMELKQVADPLDSLVASLDPTSGWSGRAFLFLGLALAALWLWRLARPARSVVPIALVLLTCVDLLSFARDFHPRLPVEAVAARGPAARFLAEHSGLHRVLTVQPVWETAPNRLVPLRVQEANGYSSLLPDRHRAFLTAAERGEERLLDLMGVRYLVVRRSSPPARLRLGEPVFRDDEVDVHERPSARPRAWIADRAIAARTEADALLALTRTDFDPAREVVIEGAAPSVAAGPGAPGDAEIVEYQSERVRVRAATERGGYLVLADTYYPGWRALVDGVDQPILRADYLFRAVALAPGEHTIEFVYDPLSVKVGAVASLVTLLAVSAVLAVTLVEAPRPRARRSAETLALDPAAW
jgi:hypothetical protein